jgi:hypothetical protein
LIHRRLELEVELFEQLHRREVRDLDGHRDALLLLGVELFAEKLVEEVEIRRLLSSGQRQDRIESRGHRAESQSCQPLLDASPNDLAHAAPATTAA